MSAASTWRPVQKIRPISIAIVRRKSEILVMTVRDDSGVVKGYRPPGGGIEFGETAEQAVKREFLEEFDLSIQKIERVFIVENIYRHHETTGHEIVFVHRAEFSDPSANFKSDYSFVDSDVLNECSWICIDEFRANRLRLFPDGLIELLIE